MSVSRYQIDKRRRHELERHQQIIAKLTGDTIADFHMALEENPDRPCRTNDEYPNPYYDWDQHEEYREPHEVAPPTARRARELCEGCPLLDTDLCYDYARATKQKHGIWGGKRFQDGKLLDDGML